jgi:PHS family inorganic phosphate transporter-like MFS transporter
MASYHEQGSNSDVDTKQPVVTSTTHASAAERRKAALAEVDQAKFSWFHAKVCVVAGIGFYTDAYDIFAINIASTMLGYLYGAAKGPALNSSQSLGVKVATPVGTFCGQLLFGWLADVVGRKRMYGIELMIIIVATFGQAVSGTGDAVSIIGVLVVWRFIMGVGVGGDYPLSAVISSEFAATKIRGRMMTAVFAAQGWGNFTAALVALIITSAYKNTILSSPSITQLHGVDAAWRLLIGLGCVPATVALYFRLTIPETPRFTMDIERNVDQASTDIENVISGQEKELDEDAHIQRIQVPKASWADFRHHFGQWKNFKLLFGAAYSWFALDIAFYGLGLNSGIILQTIGFGGPFSSNPIEAVYQNLRAIAIGNLILSAAGLIPGYYVSFFLIDVWGRKPIQLMGFTVLTILFIIMGFGFDALTSNTNNAKAFVFLYCLADFFQNFGPNVTTFVIPGEIFPTRYRSTANGISAASGKLGAIISQVGFSQLLNIGGTNKFLNHLLEILAFFMLTGIFSTLLLPETKGLTLEELSNEDQDGFVTAPKRKA